MSDGVESDESIRSTFMAVRLVGQFEIKEVIWTEGNVSVVPIFEIFRSFLHPASICFPA